MRFILSLLIGKIIRIIGKPFNKATNLPGQIALKICPDLFKNFAFKGKVLAVTGSNGKTSTANLVAHIISKNQYSVVNNAKGSNLTGGIATTLLSSSNLKGYIDKDYVVLECDERYSRFIFKDLKVDYLLVTNLFRDQLTRNGNVDVIIDCLNQAIKPETTLILNGNDPISSLLAINNKRVYYAMEKTDKSTNESINITHDAKVCPKCFGKMNYQYFHYNHIGKFKCEHCGYENFPSKYLASDINFENGDFKVNGNIVSTTYKSAFNFLNTLAAISLCAEIGINITDVCNAASTFKPLKERYEILEINSRKAIMILSKNQNPVSFDQSITYCLDQPGEKTVVCYINNINHTNNKDTTWLYDISFERLNNKINSIVCAGPRSYDLAVRLKLGNFNMNSVIIVDDLANIKDIINQTKGDIYILTELYDAQTIIGALKR